MQKDCDDDQNGLSALENLTVSLDTSYFMSANRVLRLPQNNGTLNTAVQPSRNNLVPREGMQWSRPSSSLPLLDKHCAVPSKYPPSLYEVLAGQAEYTQGCICNHPDQVKTSQSSQSSQG
ncbi:hypothetical protein FOWG_06998 [Fusarium oxysporum f. sp. lycopersici MN25]|nr:hypothetical protein FOWG_06998 [Fusarium oxysporum f. sp. lycopersici MN25]